VAWNPVAGSNRVAYTNANGCGEIHVSSVDTTLTDFAVRQFPSCSGFPYYLPYSPRFIDWSPAGDSLLFDVQFDQGTVVAAVPATTGSGIDVRVIMTGTTEHPAWTDQGILFVTPTSYYRLFLRRPDGSIVQVRPDNVDNFLPGMKRVP